MTNQEILEKLREDMELRNFSVYTKGNYESIAKIVMKHFSKPLEQVTTGELRNYLIGTTKEEGKSIRTANYHNNLKILKNKELTPKTGPNESALKYFLLVLIFFLQSPHENDTISLSKE